MEFLEIEKRVKDAAEQLKFFCPECEKEKDFIWLDGYPVGDRLLEGVMFEVRLKKGDKYEVKPSDDAEAYLENLNGKKWLDAMKRYAAEADFGQCPDCEEDVDMPFLS